MLSRKDAKGQVGERPQSAEAISEPPRQSATTGSRRRGKNGCLTCRTNKTVCDNAPGICSPCSRNGLQCIQQEQSTFLNRPLPAPEVSPARVNAVQKPPDNSKPDTGQSQPVLNFKTQQRSRLPPCNHCQQAKRKCCQSRPICSNCISRGFTDCQYPPAKPLKRARTSNKANKDKSSTRPLGNVTSPRKQPVEEQEIDDAPSYAGSHVESHGRFTSSLESEPETPENIYPLLRHTLPDRLPHIRSMIGIDQTAQEDNVGLTPSFESPSSIDSSFVAPGSLSQRIEVAGSPPNVLSLLTTADMLASRHFMYKHVDAYFRFFHGLSTNSFLHRATFVKSVSQGKVSRVVLLAVCAAASRYINQGGEASTHRDGSELARIWIREAVSLLYDNDQICLDNTVAALILSRHAIQSGRYGQAWTLVAIANRQAVALGLHNDSAHRHKAPPQNGPATETTSFTETEMRRRVMWSCYCCDRMMSTGIREFTLCPSECLNIPLPVESSNFDLDIPSKTPFPVLDLNIAAAMPNGTFQEPSMNTVGLMGHHVRLVTLRYAVLNYTKHMASKWAQGSDLPWMPDSALGRCQSHLESFRQGLPRRFELNDEVLFARHANGELHSLVMLHIWWHKLFCELYQFSLPGQVESIDQEMLASAPPGWIDGIRSQCLQHALAITGVVAMVEGTFSGHGTTASTPMTIMDPSLPFILFDSVRLQLRSLSPIGPAGDGAQLNSGHDSVVFQARCAMLINHLKRITTCYANAKRFLVKMQDILYQNGVEVPEYHHQGEHAGNDNDRVETVSTPNHPWTDKVQQQNQMDREHGISVFDNFFRCLPTDWTAVSHMPRANPTTHQRDAALQNQRFNHHTLHDLAQASEAAMSVDQDGWEWEVPGLFEFS